MPNRLPVGDAAVETAITLSIIISTYNARDVLADCLQSIYRNPPSLPYKIIVDDASTDGTAEMVCARFPEVRLLRNKVNLHYTKSNNRALDYARGQYLHLLNNDAIVMPLALDHMLAFLGEHFEGGAVGSKLLNEDRTTQSSVKSLRDLGSALFGGRSTTTWTFTNNRFSRKSLFHLDRDSTLPFIAGYLSGASKMMPRRIVEKVD